MLSHADGAALGALWGSVSRLHNSSTYLLPEPHSPQVERYVHCIMGSAASTILTHMGDYFWPFWKLKMSTPHENKSTERHVFKSSKSSPIAWMNQSEKLWKIELSENMIQWGVNSLIYSSNSDLVAVWRHSFPAIIGIPSVNKHYIHETTIIIR